MAVSVDRPVRCGRENLKYHLDFIVYIGIGNPSFPFRV